MITTLNEFKKFLKKFRYKLVSSKENDIIKALKWFNSNSDITNGFIQASSEDGNLVKTIIVEDHRHQYIKKTNLGYEIEVGLFNYDGKILSTDKKWNLDFIQKYMKKDDINCEILDINDILKELNTYGTSGEAPPFWKAKGITITLDDVMKYLDDNNIPTVEIPVKDIFNLCAHRDKTDKETLDRSERSDLKYPIIVLKKNGKYHMVLDGHHRILKANNNNIAKIKARVFELTEAPESFQKVLY